MVKRRCEICQKAGIEGRFTNHSLRATSACKMYQSKILEQVIKEITGHKSDCVWIYKRTSDVIHQEASATISGSVEHCGSEKKIENDREVESDKSECKESNIDKGAEIAKWLS